MPEYKFSKIMRSYLRKGCDHKSPRTIKAEASCANVLLRAFGDYWLSPDPAGSGKRKMLTGAVRGTSAGTFVRGMMPPPDVVR